MCLIYNGVEQKSVANRLMDVDAFVCDQHLLDAMADHAHHGVLAYTKSNLSIACATPWPRQASDSLKLAPLSCVVPAAILQRRI